MAKRRKHINRAELRRRRQLREIQERQAEKERLKINEQDFNFPRFIRNHSVELFFVAILILGILAIMVLGPDRKKMQELRESVSNVLLEYAWQWDDLYPNGYKVLSLTEHNIIPTTYDTLPAQLKIDWKNIKIERIQDEQITGFVEKIRIRVDNIKYAPAGIDGLSVSTALLRQKGASSTFARLGERSLFVTIVEDTGDQVFCLFGLK